MASGAYRHHIQGQRMKQFTDEARWVENWYIPTSRTGNYKQNHFMLAVFTTEQKKAQCLYSFTFWEIHFSILQPENTLLSLHLGSAISMLNLWHAPKRYTATEGSRSRFPNHAVGMGTLITVTLLRYSMGPSCVTGLAPRPFSAQSQVWYLSLEDQGIKAK